MRKNYLTCAALISAMSMSTIASAPVFASDNSDAQTFKIGICNYVDDASLNQFLILKSSLKKLKKILTVLFLLKSQQKIVLLIPLFLIRSLQTSSQMTWI